MPFGRKWSSAVERSQSRRRRHLTVLSEVLEGWNPHEVLEAVVERVVIDVVDVPSVRDRAVRRSPDAPCVAVGESLAGSSTLHLSEYRKASRRQKP